MTDHAQQQLANGDRIDRCITCGRIHKLQKGGRRDPAKSGPYWCIVQLGEQLEQAQSELAALRAKLPTYANGKAFVPEVDDCWVRWGNQPAKIAPCRDNGRWCVYDQTRFYPTAAECEEGEGKSVIAYAKADHIAAGQAVTKRLRDDGTAATPRGEEVG